MDAYKERLHLFEFGDTLPGNVVAMEAVGHTPGHTVFQSGKLLVIGDLIHGAALQLEHPEYCASYDMDKEAAVKARKYFLQYAKDIFLLRPSNRMGECQKYMSTFIMLYLGADSSEPLVIPFYF